MDDSFDVRAKRLAGEDHMSDIDCNFCTHSPKEM